MGDNKTVLRIEPYLISRNERRAKSEFEQGWTAWILSRKALGPGIVQSAMLLNVAHSTVRRSQRLVEVAQAVADKKVAQTLELPFAEESFMAWSRFDGKQELALPAVLDILQVAHCIRDNESSEKIHQLLQQQLRSALQLDTTTSKKTLLIEWQGAKEVADALSTLAQADLKPVVALLQANEVYNAPEPFLRAWMDSMGGKVAITKGSGIRDANLEAFLKKISGICTDLSLESVLGMPSAAQGAKQLGPVIAAMNLSGLRISQNKVCLSTAKMLRSHLVALTGLQNLDISDNSLGVDGVKAFAPALACFGNLKSISIAGNALGDKGVALLVPHLKNLTKLQDINFAVNGISADGIRAVSPVLAALPGLHKLDLSFNRIGAGGMRKAAKSLSHTRSVKHLDVRANKVDDEGMVASAEYLGQLANLQHLDLRLNSFGDEGMGAVLSHLASLKFLQHLDVRNCQLSGAANGTIQEKLVSVSKLCL